MKHNKLMAVMALILTLSLSSCSDEDKNTQQSQAVATKAVTVRQAQSGILSYIPADTPVLAFYVQDANNPMPQNLKNKMGKMYSGVVDLLKTALQEKLEKSSDDNDKIEMKEFMDKWLTEEGVAKLGLDITENEVAIYTVDLFPVFRMTLAKTHAMNEVLNDLMAKANESKPDTAIKKDVNGSKVYQFGDKELQFMVSLDGNTLVASLAPTREVDNLMPKLLGFEKPIKSITQSDQYQNVLNKYNYLTNSMYWVNIRDLADYFVNPDQHQSAMLDVLKVQDNMLSPDCKTEILGIFDKFPRLVGGTTLLDEHNMASHMIIEMTNGLGAKLEKLSGRIPMSDDLSALSYGVSFDVVAAKELAMEFVTNIEAQPYKCELLAGMNTQATEMKAQINQPLPPFVGNFKGINVVIDELDLDLSKKDPKEMIKNLKAKVLVAVDNPEALQGMAEMMMPDLQKLGIKVDGGAVNISSLIPVTGSQIPVNLDFVFLAMGQETIGVSIGENTDVTLTKAASADASSNLLEVSVTAELYKNIFTGLSEMASNLPEEAQKQLKMQQSMLSDMLWWEKESATLDFTDRGFEVNVDIDY
jgi:hypothetical protein